MCGRMTRELISWGPKRLRLLVVALAFGCAPAGFAQGAVPPRIGEGEGRYIPGRPEHARWLLEQYRAQQQRIAQLEAEIARIEATLPQGVHTWATDSAAELARRRQVRELQKQAAEERQRLRPIEEAWDHWYWGQLGPITDSNETIDDPYLDKSVYPPVIRYRKMDKISYRLKYFPPGRSFVSVKKRQSDWYCTNRPQIQTPLPLPDIVRGRNPADVSLKDLEAQVRPIRLYWEQQGVDTNPVEDVLQALLDDIAQAQGPGDLPPLIRPRIGSQEPIDDLAAWRREQAARAYAWYLRLMTNTDPRRIRDVLQAKIELVQGKTRERMRRAVEELERSLRK